MFLLVQYFCVYKNTTNFPNFQIILLLFTIIFCIFAGKIYFTNKVFYNKIIMGNKKEYNQYLWAQEQPRVYDASPLAISFKASRDFNCTKVSSGWAFIIAS